MAKVHLREVVRRFDDLVVLDNFSLDVAEGDVLSLVGPSGCGKSTILRIMAGLETPDGGDCACHYRRVGFVFQEPRLLPWLTARENALLPLQGWDAQARRRGQAMLSRLFDHMHLTGFEDYYPPMLSGGMQRRVAIARALIVEPDFLLLDEPFSGLDFPLRLKLIHLLHDLLQRHNTTTVYVTHDVREAVLLSSRLVVLSSRPARLMRSYALPALPPAERLVSDEVRRIETQVTEFLLSAV